MRGRVAAGAVLLAGLLAAGAAAVLVEAVLPASDARLVLPGLTGPVEVRYDGRGIPRIRAGDRLDADEAIGFVQARDRMMQMDLMRRAASGRLSELLGASTLRIDTAARVLGVEQAAERMEAELPAPALASLRAYARGVNAFIDRRGRFASLEYLVLGPPAPWRPVDSLLWAETMGLALSGNLDTEIERLALSPRLDRRQILALWPVPGARQRPPGRTGARAAPGDAGAALAAALLPALPRFPAPFTLPDTASNEWAVDGTRSRSGAPLLAGDPHLSYALPCLWYLARIDLPDQTLVGAMAPGTPFLVLGRNRRIAWTFTTTGADTEDLFVEHVLDRDRYAGPDGPLAFAHRREVIRVRGGPDRVIDVRATRHGPVLSDLPALFGLSPSPAGTVLAGAIASLLPGNVAAAGLLALDDAGSVAQAGEAAARITAPVQNLLVADAHAIGLFTTGRVPVRRSGDGAFAVDGADGASDWTGWRSGNALPRILAPADGILVNANEPVVGAGAGAPLSRDAFGDWRARRIREILEGPAAPRDVGGFASMQGDVRDLLMRDLLPVLRRTVPADDRSRRALRLIETWNGDMAGDLAAPLIAAAWVDALEQRLADARSDPAMLAMRPDALLAGSLAGFPAGSAAMLSATLSEALGPLAARYGEDPGRWRWDRPHRARFDDPLLGRLPVIGAWTGLRPPVGGGDDTIDAQAWRGTDYAAVHGAAFRAAYDLADPEASRFAIATGQSGQLFSPHRTDFVDDWRRIRTVTIPAAPDRVTARLSLVPGTPAAAGG